MIRLDSSTSMFVSASLRERYLVTDSLGSPLQIVYIFIAGVGVGGVFQIPLIGTQFFGYLLGPVLII